MYSLKEIQEIKQKGIELEITISGAFGKERKEKVKVVGILLSGVAILSNGMQIPVI